MKPLFRALIEEIRYWLARPIMWLIEPDIIVHTAWERMKAQGYSDEEIKAVLLRSANKVYRL